MFASYLSLSSGTPVPEDPAKSLRPSGMITLPAFMVVALVFER